MKRLVNFVAFLLPYSVYVAVRLWEELVERPLRKLRCRVLGCSLVDEPGIYMKRDGKWFQAERCKRCGKQQPGGQLA